MPKKRPPPEITEEDVELSKVTKELRKQIRYAEPEDGYMILKEASPRC